MEKISIKEIRTLAKSLLFNNENFLLNEISFAPDIGTMDAGKNMRYIYDQAGPNVNSSASVFEKEDSLPVSPTQVTPTQLSVAISPNVDKTPTNKTELKHMISHMLDDKDLHLDQKDINKVFSVFRKYFKSKKGTNLDA